VRLCNLKSEYKDKCPKSLEVLGKRMIDHCLEYLVLDSCPSITIRDDADDSVMSLNDYFATHMRIEVKEESFKVKKETFTVHHIRLTTAQDTYHAVHYCARNRVVETERLSKSLPNVGMELKDDNGKRFVYGGYVSSSYLDERVANERMGFTIYEDSELDFPDYITWVAIRERVTMQVSRFLAPYTEPIQKAKEKQIQEYFQNTAPQFRPLVKHKKEWLEDIPPNLAPDKLDLELYKKDQKYEAELREKAHKIIAETPDSETREDEEKQFEEFLQEWNEKGMARLANYIAFRKATLSFLERKLKLQPDGSYAAESSVHKIIFPLKKTSDDLRADKMNLWIIDEKLAYHFYLASDKPLDQVEVVDVDSKDRPDILIFDQPFAFVDSGQPFGAVVIIEFKRPMRKEYDEKENPVSQVLRYVSQIKQGKTVDRDGRPINVSENTPFYAYIVCDLTPNVRRLALEHSLIAAPDGLGYFGFNQNYGVFVEIISFDKLLADSKKRNAILFEKLGLPPT